MVAVKKKAARKKATTKAAVKKATAKASADNGKDRGVRLRPIKKRIMKLSIVGTSPMIQHQWSDKALQMMRDKHQGKKTKNRETRDPDKEFQEATYRTDKGDYGIPLTALKGALICAAHKDIGIEKTLVKKAIFIPCKDSGGILKMECPEPPVMREDPVRVGQGSADLRYRPHFAEWSVEVQFEIDAELLTEEDVLSLVDRAGFGVGICEWRPEKGGEHGRFEVDRTKPIKTVEV
jgi:hypothetical protein